MKRLQVLALVLFVAPSVFAKDVIDMVLVPAPSPFYISIFEATKDQRKVLPLNQAEAQSYCRKLGMKVPTREQWLQAASAGGKNQNYTLKGDGTTIENGFNYRSSASVGVYDIAKLGLDAIGTVGMSGNRAEWVVESDGTAGQCGGDYRLKNVSDFQLKNICVGENRFTQNVTVRCVIDYAPDIRVQYSPNVKGELATYVQEVSQMDQLQPQIGQPSQQTPAELAPGQKPKLDEEF